jgi:hypothetical protein
MPKSKEQIKASHRLVRDCDIFHGVMFFLSICCVGLVSLVFGYLAGSGKVDKEVAGRWVASTCAIWAVLLTLYLIYLHVIYYANPLEQRCIVRILVMVIVYAVDSFAALLWHTEAIWIDVLRDTYEAYVIFTFFTLMMQYLKGPENIVQEYWKNGTETMPHPAPLCCLSDVHLNRSTLLFWEFCALQYTIINPLLSVITLILYFSSDNLYIEGTFDVNNSYPWIAGIRFISVTFAFTALVYFFLATNKHMADKKPLGKFISIKIIVFFSFWQSVALSGLSHFNVIKPTQFWSSDSIATGASNFLLCIEMWLIAVAHKWVFSHEPYAEVPDEEISWVPQWAVIQDIFFCSDAMEQLRSVVGGVTTQVGESLHETGAAVVGLFKKNDNRRHSVAEGSESETDGSAESINNNNTAPEIVMGEHQETLLSKQQQQQNSGKGNSNKEKVVVIRQSEDI